MTTMFNGNLLVYGLLFMAMAIAITLYKKSYKILEKMAVGFMTLMFIAFFITLCITGIDVLAFLKGLIPDFKNTGALFYALAIFLTNSSQQGAIHQYVVKQNNYSKEEVLTDCKTDNIISTVFVVLIIGMIMSVSAETIGKIGQVPTSAPDFVLMLEPMAGKAAKYIFGFGLLGAATTSLNGSSQVVGLGFADAFGILKNGYEDKVQKIITIVTIIVMGLYGLLPVYFETRSPLNIYIIAALMTSITIPICGTCILIMFRDKEKMGNLVYPKWKNVFAWMLFIFIVAFCLYNFVVKYLF